MCELEGKLEFCEGVKKTLDIGRKELEKIINKIKVEESQGRSCVWNIDFKQTDKHNLEELGNKVQDIHQVKEEERIEFELLNELINEGKLSFFSAVVLVIRERASLLAKGKFFFYKKRC